MFSEPAVKDRFFGRDDILELLNKRVCALKEGYRQNVALTGQSLSGKSSIILHFLHTIREEGFVDIYVEIVKEPFVSFLDKFIATMLYSVFTKMGLGFDMDLEKLLESAEKALPKTYHGIKKVIDLADNEKFDEAYSEMLSLTSILKSETALPCIVILDEFDNLEHIGVKNPFLNFGKVIMVQKDTMYIVSSSRNRAIKKIISEKLSLLFGNFEVVKVANFDLASSEKFIDMKLAGFDIDNSLKQFLYVFTDGNPFYLDQIASRAKSLAIERMSSCIDNEVIEDAILDLVYSANGSIHQYLMNFLLNLLDSKTRDTHFSVLIAIANGHRKQSAISRNARCKPAETAKALTYLLEAGLLSKSGVFYRIDDSMLEFWLKFVYQRRKGLLIGGTFDSRILFKSGVKKYIADFEEDLSENSASRIARLFNLFSNELVEIESRHIRLPHFTKVEVKNFIDGKKFISASFNRNFWVVVPYESCVTENDIVDYIKNIKSLECKVSNKIIMPLKGMDENAKLLAKELKISIWDGSVTNELLYAYGMNRMAII